MEKKKMSLSTILLLFAIVIIVALCIYFFIDKANSNKKINEYADSYSRAMEALTSMTTEGRYPEVFYATIESISDVENLKDVKSLKVQGLDINEKAYRGKFDVQILLDNIKLQHNGKDKSFEELKVGQRVAVYDYSFGQNSTQPNTLNSVYKLVILD